MKTLNRKPFLVLLTLATIGVAAVSGCKKKAPPTTPPADTTAQAPAPDTNAPAPEPAAPAPATPAPAPADSASTAAPGSVPLIDPNAFQSSDPHLQDLWNTAITAAQTNGWATTYNSLMAIRLSHGLSSGQTAVVSKNLNAVGMAMFTAANNGDAAAAAALSHLRTGHQHQQAPQ